MKVFDAELRKRSTNTSKSDDGTQRRPSCAVGEPRRGADTADHADQAGAADVRERMGRELAAAARHGPSHLRAWPRGMQARSGV